VRILKVRETFIARRGNTRERRTASIILSGDWLEQHGFRAGGPAYVHEIEEGLLISPCPPAPVNPTPIEELKAEYERLGIPTTRDRREYPGTVEAAARSQIVGATQGLRQPAQSPDFAKARDHSSDRPAKD
jgi:hypothetical protein